MAFSSIPPELLYEIVIDLFAEFVDTAVTCPPAEERALAAARSERISANRDEEAEGDGGDEEEEEIAKELDDDELNSALQLWEQQEANESLPENPLKALLAVCHSLRETTLKVIEDAFGFKRNTAGTFDRNPWFIIRRMRRHYRLARTELIPNLGPADDEVDITSSCYVAAYFIVSDMALFFRKVKAMMKWHMVILQVISDKMQVSLQAMGDTVEDIPHPTLCRRLARRAFVQTAWARNMFILIELVGLWTSAVIPLCESKEVREEDQFKEIREKLRDTMRALNREHKKYFDPMDAPYLPGPILKKIEFCDLLQYTSSFPHCGEKDAAITEARNIAKALLPRWSPLLKTTFYIDIL